jgi:hypothetical protein
MAAGKFGVVSGTEIDARKLPGRARFVPIHEKQKDHTPRKLKLREQRDR